VPLRSQLCALATPSRVRRWIHWALGIVLIPAAWGAEPQRPSPLKSGIEFAGAEVRALQQDDFANPGMHWVARGEKLWSTPAGKTGKACAVCHGAAETSMKGVATHYPKIDTGAGRLVNLEGRINLCRARHQEAEPFAYESEDLLALTAYIASLSRRMPMSVAVDGQNRERFERGREFYYQRRGQMNLSCTHCHERNAGRKLLAETISQGHGNDYPAYRLEWQTMGSLHRRFRSCLYGVRAEMLPLGSPELLDLELFLAWRAQGLPIETPGVRR
jgi:sulfur-oxidizing protein SoxA